MLNKKGIVVRNLPLESIYLSLPDSVTGTLRICDLMFANYIELIKDEEEFALERIYEQPPNLYMRV